MSVMTSARLGLVAGPGLASNPSDHSGSGDADGDVCVNLDNTLTPDMGKQLVRTETRSGDSIEGLFACAFLVAEGAATTTTLAQPSYVLLSPPSLRLWTAGPPVPGSPERQRQQAAGHHSRVSEGLGGARHHR